jgi:hypothetical protein
VPTINDTADFKVVSVLQTSTLTIRKQWTFWDFLPTKKPSVGESCVVSYTWEISFTPPSRLVVKVLCKLPIPKVFNNYHETIALEAASSCLDTHIGVLKKGLTSRTISTGVGKRDSVIVIPHDASMVS